MRLPLKDIKPNPDNPRIIKDDKFQKLVQSLKDLPEMAEVREIVVNKDHIILGGNMRYKAMQEAGWTDAPVKIVDWPEDKQKEFIIKDNVSGGEWDWDAVANQYELADLDAWGVDLPDSLMADEEVEEDEAPEVSDEPPVSKLGEVYQLGRHRIMCGDSLDNKNVQKLLSGAKVDMVFTDPPYGMDLDADYSKRNSKGKTPSGYNRGSLKRHKHEQVIGDDMPYDPTHLFKQLDCKEMFLWGADYYAERIPDREKGSWFVWDKRHGIEDAKFTLSEFELVWSKTKHAREICRVRWFGIMGLENDDVGSRVHPTQKPVKLCSWFIERFSKSQHNIVDLFLGSGSTLIACEQTDRTCYGMELDPKYVDLIRKRYHKFVAGDIDGWEEATAAIAEEKR